MASSQFYGYANESHQEFNEYSERVSQEIATGQCQSYYKNNAAAGNPGPYYGHTFNPSHGHKHGQFHTHIANQKIHGYGPTYGSQGITDQTHNHGNYAKHHVHKKTEKKKYTDSYGNVVEYYSGSESGSDDEYYSDGHGRGC